VISWGDRSGSDPLTAEQPSSQPATGPPQDTPSPQKKEPEKKEPEKKEPEKKEPERKEPQKDTPDTPKPKQDPHPYEPPDGGNKGRSPKGPGAPGNGGASPDTRGTLPGQQGGKKEGIEKQKPQKKKQTLPSSTITVRDGPPDVKDRVTELIVKDLGREFPKIRLRPPSGHNILPPGRNIVPRVQPRGKPNAPNAPKQKPKWSVPVRPSVPPAPPPKRAEPAKAPTPDTPPPPSPPVRPSRPDDKELPVDDWIQEERIPTDKKAAQGVDYNSPEHTKRVWEVIRYAMRKAARLGKLLKLGEKLMLAREIVTEMRVTKRATKSILLRDAERYLWGRSGGYAFSGGNPLLTQGLNELGPYFDYAYNAGKSLGMQLGIDSWFRTKGQREHPHSAVGGHGWFQVGLDDWKTYDEGFQDTTDEPVMPW
jgi:hypothetical protein